MARQNINIGSNANDGTGDPLRTAFDKINDNFTELYGSTDEANDLLDDDTPQLGGNLDVNGQRIITARSNENIVLDANGTGEVVVEGDTRVKGDLYAQGRIYLGDEASDITQVTGKLEVDGLEFNSSNITGLVTNSNITITPNGTGDVVLAKATTIAEQLTVDSNIRIKDNKIEATSSNSDIEISASGTGSIGFKSAVTTLGQTVTGNIEQTGNNFITGLLQVSGSAEIDDIKVDGSTITTLLTNSDVTISGNGSGSVVIADIDVGGGEIDGTPIGANSASTGSFTTITATTSAAIDGVTISDNKVSTNASNSNLQLEGNGTGKVEVMDELTGTFDITNTGNIITTGNITTRGSVLSDRITSPASNADLQLVANGTGNVDVQSTMTTLGQTITGNVDITGDVTIDNNLQFTDNSIRATASNSGITIQPSGTGIITLAGNVVAVLNELAATDIAVSSEIQMGSGAAINQITTNQDLILGTQGSGTVRINNPQTQTTVGAAGAGNALPATPEGYLKLNLGGTEYVIPFYAAS